MTEVGNATSASHKGADAKPLKERNRWPLWVIVAINLLFLCGVIEANAIETGRLRTVLMDAQHLVPVGVALIITTVLNGLLSSETKARLVFLRWHHALPGHRAFTVYAARDPRIDVVALEKVVAGSPPSDPVSQNRAWYRMYASVENDAAVRQVHQDYLLLRDYTALSALFLLWFGAAGFYAIPSLTTWVIYIAMLLGQYAVVRHAAVNYGVRFVTTVLARRAALG